jgi:type IV pilus assembly protein PilB
MPTISPEISNKITGLLKSMGKVSEQSISDAQKKYDGNGKTPLGILTYLIEDKIVAEEDIVTAVSRNYALRKVLLNEQTIKKDALLKVPKDFITQNEIVPFELNGRILKVAIFDPTKSTLVGKLKSMTGCNIELYIAKPSNIDEALRYKTITELDSENSESKKKKYYITAS